MATKAFTRHPTDMARYDLGIKGQAEKKKMSAHSNTWIPYTLGGGSSLTA